jgi:hypothetical protein
MENIEEEEIKIAKIVLENINPILIKDHDTIKAWFMPTIPKTIIEFLNDKNLTNKSIFEEDNEIRLMFLYHEGIKINGYTLLIPHKYQRISFQFIEYFCAFLESLNQENLFKVKREYLSKIYRSHFLNFHQSKGHTIIIEADNFDKERWSGI